MPDLFKELLGMQDYPAAPPRMGGVDLFDALSVTPDPQLSHPVAGQMLEAGYSPDEIAGVEIDAPRDPAFYRQELAPTARSVAPDVLASMQARRMLRRDYAEQVQRQRYAQDPYLDPNVYAGQLTAEELSRNRISRAPVIGPIYTGVQQSALSTLGAVARAFGQEDEAQVIGSASRELERGGASLGGMLQGAARSYADMLTGAAGGFPGILAVFGTKAANDAIDEGRSAGLSGPRLGRYALEQAAIEMVVTAAFQRAGLGGVESYFTKSAKPLVKRTVMDAVGRATGRTLAELPEELSIEILQSLSSYLEGVDTRELSDPTRLSDLGDVVLQTIATVGLGEVGAQAGVRGRGQAPPGVGLPSPPTTIQEAVAQREQQQQEAMLAQAPELEGEVAGGLKTAAKPQWAVLEAASALAQTQERVDPVAISQQLNVPAEQAVNAWRDLVRMNVLDAEGRPTGQQFQQPASVPEIETMLSDPEATIDRAVRSQLPAPGIEQARVQVEEAIRAGEDPRRSPALRDLAFELARRTQQVRAAAPPPQAPLTTTPSRPSTAVSPLTTTPSRPSTAVSPLTTTPSRPSTAVSPPQMGAGRLGAVLAEAGVRAEKLPPGPAEVAVPPQQAPQASQEPVQAEVVQPPDPARQAQPEPRTVVERPAIDVGSLPETMSAIDVAVYASQTDSEVLPEGFQSPEGYAADIQSQLKNSSGRFVKAELPLALFSTDVTVDDAKAKRYATEGGALPPIVAGLPRGVRRATKLAVPDGNYRVAAAKIRGQTRISAYVPAADIDQIATIMRQLGIRAEPVAPDPAKQVKQVKQAEPVAETQVGREDDRMIPAGRVRRAIEAAKRQGEKIGRSVDAMTGILNRVGFKDAANRLNARADKENQPVAYVFMDLANLKQFNDNINAQAGDAIIMEAVNALTANIRTEARGRGGVSKVRQADVPGVVARRGGDELVAALYGVDQATANKVMERVAEDYVRRLNERGLNQRLQEATGIPNMQGFLAYGLQVREPNSQTPNSELLDTAEQGMYAYKKAKKRELGLPLSREEAEAAIKLTEPEFPGEQEAGPAEGLAEPEPPAELEPKPAPKRMVKKVRARRPSGFARSTIERRLAKFGYTLPNVNPLLFKGEIPSEIRERFEGQVDILTKLRKNEGAGRGEDIVSAIGLDRYEQYIRSWLGEADGPVARMAAEMIRREPGIEPTLAFDAWLYNEIIPEEQDAELIGRLQLQPGATFTINGSQFEVGYIEGDSTVYMIGPVTVPVEYLPEQIPIDTGTYGIAGEAIAPFDLVKGQSLPSRSATKQRSQVDPPPPERDLFVKFRSPEGVQVIRFKSKDVNARSVHAPELIQLAEELLGSRPKATRLESTMRGAFRSGGESGSIVIDFGTAANPEQLLKTLAHEIGHAHDWMPDKTLARGNLIGRLIGHANKFLEQEFGGLDNKALRDELIAMSKVWREDFDENGESHYDRYRRSSVELYADFVSVFLNDPVRAKSMAPTFFDAFVKGLERKPEFSESYVRLMSIMDGDSAEMMRAREHRATASYEDGRAKINAAIQARRTANKTGLGRFFDSLTTLLLNRYNPIEKLQRGVEAEGVVLPDSANARYIINDLTHAENEQHKYINDLEQIMVEAREAGLDLDGDLGFYLENNRIASEGRTKVVVGEDDSEIVIEIANPRGTQIQDAEANLRNLVGRLGPGKTKALQAWAKKFYDLNWSIIERLHRSGAISDKMLASLKKNKYNYAAFAVTKHLGDTLSPSIIRQVGTFSDIANPVESTMMKSLSMIRFATLNEAKRDIGEKFLKPFTPNTHRRVSLPPGQWEVKAKPGIGLDWLTYKNDGRWFALEVDRDIAKSFKSKDIGEIGRVLGFLRTPTYRVFHPLYVSWSTAFFTRNLFFRDRRRLVKNIGAKTGVSAFRLNVEWLKAMPHAWRRARGVPDSVIDEMLQMKALATPFVKSTAMIDDIDFQSRKAVEAGLRRMKPDRTPAVLKPFKILTDMVESLNVFGETVAKVGGWKALKRAGVEGRERAYLVDRYVGTPPWTRKGDATFMTNTIFFYSNVRWQGLSADLDLAKNPKTAAGYWWRTVLHNLLPKALMLAAAEGVFGDDLEELMKAVPDWAKENYDVIPIGFVGEGDATKPIFIAMPPDDTGRFMGALFWKLLNAYKHRPGETTQGVMRELYGQTGVGSLNPVLGLISNWTQYLIGRNPYDAFRERPILPRDVYSAQGWYAAKHMINYSLEQTGILRAFLSPITGEEADANPMSQVERALSLPAGATGLVRISGGQGDHWETVALEQQESDRFRLGLPGNARRLVRRRYSLGKFQSVGKASREQVAELRRLQRWYSKIYLPYTQRLKIAEERGDKKSANYWRNQLEVVSDRFSKQGKD